MREHDRPDETDAAYTDQHPDDSRTRTDAKKDGSSNDDRTDEHPDDSRTRADGKEDDPSNDDSPNKSTPTGAGREANPHDKLPSRDADQFRDVF